MRLQSKKIWVRVGRASISNIRDNIRINPVEIDGDPERESQTKLPNLGPCIELIMKLYLQLNSKL